MRLRTTYLVLGSLAAAAGCNRGEQPLLLKPEAFLQPSSLEKQQISPRQTAVEQPGIVNYDNVRLDLLQTDEGKPAEALAEPVTVPPSVAAMVKSPESKELPADKPLPPLGVGAAAVLGRVVVEVNGEPIFSNKVLNPIEPDLAAKARETDPDQFKRIAAKAIRDQVDFLIRTELEVAAAKKNLGAQELQMADGLTEQWRRKQIGEAGGAVELARQKARAEGSTFEEKVNDEYRANLVRIYYSKRIFPRVQVNADDMRRFFDRNREQMFAERSAAQFRLIKVDVKKVGDMAMARTKADELLARAKKGDDFATIAKEYNDDARLRSAGGDVGLIEKGAFARQAVEDAVWQLNVGDVSNVIEDNNALYIAKLEQKKEGRVRGFEEEAVQDQIRNELRSRQLAELRERQREILLRDAVVNPYPPQIEPMVEIVMQKYPYWAMKTGG